MKRLSPSATQKVDLSEPLAFSWQGRTMHGLAGDSLASALFANGVTIFSRSLKYHRPRGLYSMDGESANTLVNHNGECNVRAETTPLEAGSCIKAQNYQGSVEKDRLAFMNRLDGFMSAGFYYRSMHKPAFIWPQACKMIKKMAGTGQVDHSVGWDANAYPELYPNADVGVIGGGPAGMTAALAAADQGLRVILFESRPWLGGVYDWRVRPLNGEPLHRKGAELAAQVAEHDNIRVFAHTAVIDFSGGNLITAYQVGGPDDGFTQRYIRTRAQSVVVASGCLERPLVFENNELPGVMQVGCAWRLARTYGLLPGNTAVFSVGDDLGLEAALDLVAMGLKVQAVADVRTSGQDPELVADLASSGIPLLRGQVAVSAKGHKRVVGVELSPLTGGKRSGFDCDLLVASAGLSPVNGPLSTVGAKLVFDDHTGFFLPREMPPKVHAAGRLLGLADPAAIEASGRLAGLKAACDAGSDVPFSAVEEELASLPGPARGNTVVHGPGLGAGRKAFICFDEDGTLKTARQSADQGFDQPELAKRFGGFGLGPGQGGVPGNNLALVMAGLRGDAELQLGPTKLRSPLTPVLMATLAGAGRHLFKRTPMHAQQEELGATFEKTGAWKRANRFGPDTAAKAEIRAVHNKVGMIDVSTLGKFRLFGPDALKALQRVYISDMRTIEAGKLKYSAMLNPDGMLLDDGVVTRLAENDYYFTTSSARAAQTEEYFRYHTRFEDWDYHMVNLTDHLAAVNLAGPNAREVLAGMTTADISNQALPYMGYCEIELMEQVPARVLRVGFLGELSYELHFPASYGPAVWDRILEQGAEFGIQPIGLEAQNVCRLEKGHIIIGLESEQRVNLLDLGLDFLWDRQDLASGKVGAPALKFTWEQKGRMKLVGLQMDDGQACPGDGAIVYRHKTIAGFICTARRSDALGKTIAMALVEDSLSRVGGRIDIYQNEGRGEKRFTATVVKMPFYDPQGRKLKE